MPVARVLLVTTALLLAACGGKHYTPSPDRPFEEISAFSSSNEVSLQNVQFAEDDHSLGKPGRPWYANRKKWTDVAVAIAARELTNRGMTVSDKGKRTLRLSIEDAKQKTGFVKIEATIVMKVEAGNGYSATYTGRNNSAVAAMPERQIDGAMMRVVAEMLRDPRIVSYLVK